MIDCTVALTIQRSTCSWAVRQMPACAAAQAGVATPNVWLLTVDTTLLTVPSVYHTQ